jgi:hypothetical protein
MNSAWNNADNFGGVDGEVTAYNIKLGQDPPPRMELFKTLALNVK